MAPGSLPLMPPSIAPSLSPAILFLENFLPQLCRNSGIVTHTPPPNYFGPGLPTQSSFPSYLIQHSSFGAHAEPASGKAPEMVPPAISCYSTAGCWCQDSALTQKKASDWGPQLSIACLQVRLGTIRPL